MWRLYLCIKNAQLWHHLVVDKTVEVEKKQMEFNFFSVKSHDDDLVQIKNAKQTTEIQVQTRGIAVSLILHFVDFQQGSQYDVMLLLKVKPSFEL